MYDTPVSLPCQQFLHAFRAKSGVSPAISGKISALDFLETARII